MATTKTNRPRIRKDITGKRFGRWIVLFQTDQNHKRWMCRCDCGTEKAVLRCSLTGGDSKSCGCWCSEVIKSINVTHGHSARTRLDGRCSTPEYRAWVNAKLRCFNPKQTHYRHYGGRGITMCNRWRNSFQAFLEDMGPRPDGMTIDRIDNDGHYEPGNCRWATTGQQARNHSRNRPVTWNGETMVLPDWEKQLGLKRKRLTDRRDKGWSVERIFTQPFRKSPTRNQVKRHAGT